MSAPVRNPVHGTARRGARRGHWVIEHEPVCPDCSSLNVITDQVDTGDGIEETAYICDDCGCAWPLACVFEWGADW